MFTPPPSPLPLVRQSVDHSEAVQSPNHPIELSRTPLSKQRLHRAIRWSIVPLSLMLIATLTRISAHPVIFDLLSADGHHHGVQHTSGSVWSFHEPHQGGSNHVVKRSTWNHLAARDDSTSVPTVPVNPPLPDPFPQPFDTTLSTNFSTTECYDFFLNMTQLDPFRACRPFSLLISKSYAFLQAQNNITVMNTDIWGTCNTDLSQVQCDANMSWFASSLQQSCQLDLSNQVETAMTTLNALYVYDLMRNVACQVDPATNAYCFVEAVADSSPSSYWFYQLPLGQALGPDITTSACNECTSGLMASYAAALSSANGSTLSGLAQTYNAAVEELNSVCGPSYAKAAQVSTSSAWVTAAVPRTCWVLGLSLFVLLARLC